MEAAARRRIKTTRVGMATRKVKARNEKKAKLGPCDRGRERTVSFWQSDSVTSSLGLLKEIAGKVMLLPTAGSPNQGASNEGTTKRPANCCCYRHQQERHLLQHLESALTWPADQKKLESGWVNKRKGYSSLTLTCMRSLAAHPHWDSLTESGRALGKLNLEVCARVPLVTNQRICPGRRLAVAERVFAYQGPWISRPVKVWVTGLCSIRSQLFLLWTRFRCKVAVSCGALQLPSFARFCSAVVGGRADGRVVRCAGGCSSATACRAVKGTT